MAFSPDGKTVLTGSDDGTARLWDAATGQPIGRTTAASRARSVPWRSAPTARPSSPGARTARRGSGTPPPASPSARPCTHQGRGLCRGVQPRRQDRPDRERRRHGAALGRRHRPAHRATAAASRRGPVPWRSAPTARPSSPGAIDGTARLWDAATGKPHRLAPAASRPRSVPWRSAPTARPSSPGATDGTARLWDAATGQPLGPPLQHQGGGLARRGVQPRRQDRPDRERGQHGAALGRRHRHSPSARHCSIKRRSRAVAFSPDGKTVLTGSDDGTARLWDAATGKPIGPPLPHQDAVNAVAFSPDGKTVLTGSWDKTARLWDAATGTAHRPAPDASRRGLGRGVQPRRQDRPHRERRRHGAALGRRHRPAPRPAPAASRPRSVPWRSAPTARPS